MTDLRNFPNGAVGRWIQWGTTIALVPLMVWIVSIDRWKVKTEANRWTIQQEMEYQKAHDIIHKTEIPPAAVRDSLSRHDLEIEELRDKLTEMRLMLALLLQKEGIDVPDTPK